MKQRLMDRSTNTTWMVSVTASTVYFLQSACKQKSCSYAGSLIKCQTGASFLGGFILGFVFVCVRAVTFERFLQINNYDNNKLKNSC